ncbi:hypothetical protein JOF56_003098 [Kibdelosporangium banguiense]|uniref:Gas vesicle protein n=1 Tax=Kibdelosporangium banguiense TaxID=1365924 RepID=A0ABS4TE63_9PSEU|nr:gas vesicle protein [Kibdelosporangium banguiense]MBP2322713.1 hypothetical protein [Kibdelosporangium banguiense]
MSGQSQEHQPQPAGEPGKLTPAQAIRKAVEHFGLLSGRQPDGVTGIRAMAEGGWSVLIDVVELERIPATTTVMATYRVDVDRAGELVACERLRRYTRGTTDV